MDKTYPQNWKKIAQTQKERAGYKCQWCGDDDCQLSVHHLDGDPANNEPANLVVLCAICHLSEHQRIRGHKRRQRLEAAGQLTLRTTKIRERKGGVKHETLPHLSQ